MSPRGRRSTRIVSMLSQQLRQNLSKRRHRSVSLARHFRPSPKGRGRYRLNSVGSPEPCAPHCRIASVLLSLAPRLRCFVAITDTGARTCTEVLQDRFSTHRCWPAARTINHEHEPRARGGVLASVLHRRRARDAIARLVERGRAPTRNPRDETRAPPAARRTSSTATRWRTT